MTAVCERALESGCEVSHMSRLTCRLSRWCEAVGCTVLTSCVECKVSTCHTVWEGHVFVASWWPPGDWECFHHELSTYLHKWSSARRLRRHRRPLSLLSWFLCRLGRLRGDTINGRRR